MPASTKWTSYQKTVVAFVTGLTIASGVVLALIGVIYSNMKSDISELKTDTKEITKQITEFRAEVGKDIKTIAVQSAGTNARLDQLIADGRGRR